MTFASYVNDLLEDLGRSAVSGAFWNGFFFDQPSFVVLVVSDPPAAETRFVHAEGSTDSGHITELLSMTQHLEFALNIPTFLGHAIHPSGCLSAI